MRRRARSSSPYLLLCLALLILGCREKDSSAERASGLVALQICNFEEAKARFRDAIVLNPSDARSHMYLGIVLYNTGPRDEAVHWFERAAGLAPEDSEVLFWQGLGYQGLGPPRHDKAIGCFIASIRIDPTYVPAYIDLGHSYNEIGSYESAIQTLDSAIRRDSDNALAVLKRGYAYFQLHRMDEAFTDYERASTLCPAWSLAVMDRGTVHAYRGDFNMAIADFEAAFRMDGEEPRWDIKVSIYANLAAAYLCVGKGDSASEIALRRLRQPRNDWSLPPTAIIAYLGYLQARKSRDADRFLRDSTLPTSRYYNDYPVIRYFRGEISLADLERDTGVRGGLPEVRAYVGIRDLLKGKRREGLKSLRWAVDHGDSATWFHQIARAYSTR